jgi:hypothetical protein
VYTYYVRLLCTIALYTICILHSTQYIKLSDYMIYTICALHSIQYVRLSIIIYGNVLYIVLCMNLKCAPVGGGMYLGATPFSPSSVAIGSSKGVPCFANNSQQVTVSITVSTTVSCCVIAALLIVAQRSQGAFSVHDHTLLHWHPVLMAKHKQPL